MKKIYTAMIIGTAFIATTPSYAALPWCEAEACVDITDSVDLTTGCSNKFYRCYNGTKLYNCQGCDDGQETMKTTTLSTCQGVVDYFTCCPNCKDCSSTSWTSAGGGYEQMIFATCDCGTCKKTPVYRCAAGYYGSATSAASGCSACPGNGTSSAGSTRITDCYITGTFSDSTGSGTYTGSCYYSN